MDTARKKKPDKKGWEFSSVYGAVDSSGRAPSFGAEIGALYSSSSVGLCLIGRDMTFIRVNEALARMNGVPIEDHIGRRVCDVVPGVSRPAGALMRRLVGSQEPVGPFDLEGETPAQPGVERIWSQSWTPVFDAEGEVVAASIIVIEVTEARRAERLLAERAEEVRRILDGVVAFAGRLAPDGTLTEANERAMLTAGVPREELVGRKFWDCFWWNWSKESRDRLRQAVARARGGESLRYDVEIRISGDQRAFIDFSLVPQRDAEGQVYEIIPSAVDITDRKHAEEKLQRTVARLGTILANAQIGIAIASGEGRILEANQMFLDMIGQPRKALWSGALHAKDLLPGGDLSRSEALRRDGVVETSEMDLRHASGRIVPTLSTAAMLDAKTGEHVTFFVDQTRQRADAEHRELLLLELKHRVKNMLGMVQAIAKQTARSGQDRDAFVSTLSGRLHAMARAHDLITARDNGKACLRDLIRAQVEPYSGGGARLEVDGPGVQLEPESANALGLVLHELATNAAKYGALSSATGSVSITWRRAERPGTSQVAIEWTERDGPPVTPPARRGFGTMLIETSLTHGLEGSMKMAHDPTGVVALMTVPASFPNG